ncbi:hypothetical protein Tco_0144004 [Tanacetum coccineum]
MTYNQRIQELVTHGDRMFPEEITTVERSCPVSSDMIHGSVKSIPSLIQCKRQLNFANCNDGQKDVSLNDCPKLKNGNQGNRAGNGNAVARAYVVGSAGTNPNSNVVTSTVTMKEAEVQVEKRRQLEEVPIVQDFLSTQHIDWLIRDEGLVGPLKNFPTKCYIRPSSSPWGAPVFVCQEEKVISDVHCDYRELNKLRKQEQAEHLEFNLGVVLKGNSCTAKFSKMEFWIPKVQSSHSDRHQGIHVDPSKI